MSKAKAALEATSNLQTIREIQAKVQKQHGKESMLLLGERGINKVEVVSTRSIGVDRALGIDGLPRGRIVEITGPPSSGKTTLTLHAIAEAQSMGLVCAFIDAEHALDVPYAKALGVRDSELLLSQPDCGEQALDIVESCVEGGCGVVVVDSVAALTPRVEIEGEFGSATMGAHARLMSQACRKLVALTSRHNTLIIFINQIRMKIGVVYGSPEATTGGEALKFYASIRMDIRRIKALKDGEEVTGGRTRVKITKNKLAAPFKEAEFDIKFGMGIDHIAELLDYAEELKVVERSGAWYSYQGDRLGQGRDNTSDILRRDTKLLDEITSKVKSAVAEEGFLE